VLPATASHDVNEEQGTVDVTAGPVAQHKDAGAIEEMAQGSSDAAIAALSLMRIDGCGAAPESSEETAMQHIAQTTIAAQNNNGMPAAEPQALDQQQQQLRSQQPPVPPAHVPHPSVALAQVSPQASVGQNSQAQFTPRRPTHPTSELVPEPQLPPEDTLEGRMVRMLRQDHERAVAYGGQVLLAQHLVPWSERVIVKKDDRPFAQGAMGQLYEAKWRAPHDAGYRVCAVKVCPQRTHVLALLRQLPGRVRSRHACVLRNSHAAEVAKLVSAHAESRINEARYARDAAAHA
jgi:hypothetical protein